MTGPPANPLRARLSRASWLIIPAVLLAVLYPTPFGGWLESFVHGTGVRWQDAYTALDTAEANLPRHSRDTERLLIANAMGEGDPPTGMAIGPRLHPVGTLARLRYETLDEDGERLDTWDVRALVPNIGNGVGPFWREPCRRACQDEIARSAGTRIHRSGEPGIAEEWVLRMPVGQTFALSRRPLRTQDLLDERERSTPMGSVRVGERSVPRPAQIRVTLVEACPARPRVGTVLSFEFDPYAHLPTPRGLQASRWAQLDGCGRLDALPAPQPPKEPQIYLEAAAPTAPELRALAVRRDGRSGRSDLKVDEAWVREYAKPIVVHVAAACRYDAGADRWQRMPAFDSRNSLRVSPQTLDEASRGERIAFELPREPGLYWLRWFEKHEQERSTSGERWRDAFAVVGTALCNDVSLGPAPDGRFATCVPFADHAEARFVPIPTSACGP